MGSNESPLAYLKVIWFEIKGFKICERGNNIIAPSLKKRTAKAFSRNNLTAKRECNSRTITHLLFPNRPSLSYIISTTLTAMRPDLFGHG
jgi:hypothetical protein